MAVAGKFFGWFNARPYWLALLLTLLLIGWMWSGHAEQQVESAKPDAEESQAVKKLPKVRVQDFVTEAVTRNLSLYGRTEPNRKALLGAEVSGRVVAIYAKRGASVKKGDPIVKLELNDRPKQLARAKAMLKQRQIEYTGIKALSIKGFQGKARLAEAEASLVDAQASVETLQLQITKTTIRAPMSGILNERMVEIGDYLGIGDPVAKITDIDPLIVRADVTENDIDSLYLSQNASARFVNNGEVSGAIRYISSVSNENTNTFRIEVAIDNPGNKYLAGLSAELEIPLEELKAIKVSPAVLALDKSGNLGVKTVEVGKVVFTPIQVVKADGDGAWLTGFEDKVTVITVGQGFVKPGDEVEAIAMEK